LSDTKQQGKYVDPVLTYHTAIQLTLIPTAGNANWQTGNVHSKYHFSTNFLFLS